MQLPDDLITMFTGEIESRAGTPVVRIPDRELEIGDLQRGETYRVAILPPPPDQSKTTDETAPSPRLQPRDESLPPVDEGDTLDVEIEGRGDQGDGIARIGPGYVVFVPGTDVGDRVSIEITEARDNFAFAEVVDPEPLSN